MQYCFRSLNGVDLSVCLDCERPDLSCLMWCIKCGCLLVGGGSSSNCGTSSLCACNNGRNPFVALPYFPCSFDSDPITQAHSLALEQSALLNRGSGSCVSFEAKRISLDTKKDQLSLGWSEDAISSSVPFISNNGLACQSHFSSHLRQRCISGPCNVVVNQNCQNNMWGSAPSSYFSDLGTDGFVNQGYSRFISFCPQVMVPFESSNSMHRYCIGTQSANQSINQLSDLFMGCWAGSQSSNLFEETNQDRQLIHKRRSQNQRQSWSLSDEGPSKQNGRFHGNRNTLQIKQHYLLQPRLLNSITVEKRRKPRLRPSGSAAQTPDRSINSFRNDLYQEYNMSGFSSPSSFGFHSLNKVYEDCRATNEGDIAARYNWLKLPAELWYNIVRHLTYVDRASLARTCHKLSAIVSNRYNWRVIRLDRYQHLTDSGLAMIGRKKPRHLHLTYCRGDSITNRGIDQLFRACGKRLESFSFVGCSKGAFQSDYPLLASTLHCPKLCHIDASYAHSVRDQTVRAIAEGSTSLKTLLLNGAQYISNSAIEHVVRHHKHTLERLELFGCFHLNSRIFTTLGECHGLRALAFGFLHHLSSNGLLELVSKLPLLASLDLRGTQKLVTDAILSRLAKECPLLEEIVLANMSSLTREEGVITMLRQLPRLRVLDLCGLAVVGDETLEVLAANCPMLEELDISCTSVTEVGLLCLANAPAASLKSLRISFCPRITVTAIEKLVISCPRLAHLSLYGFSWVEKWDFLFNLRSNLVIQTETQCIKPAAGEEIPP